MFKRPFATAGLAAVTMLCSMFLIAGCPQPADTGNEDPGQNDQQAGQNDQNPPGNDSPAGDDAAKGNDGSDVGNDGANNGGDNSGDNGSNDNGNDGANDGGTDDFPTEPPPGYTYDDLWALLAEYEQSGQVTWDLNQDGKVNQQDLGILIWLLWLQDHQ